MLLFSGSPGLAVQVCSSHPGLGGWLSVPEGWLYAAGAPAIQSWFPRLPKQALSLLCYLALPPVPHHIGFLMTKGPKQVFVPMIFPAPFQVEL